MMVGQMIRDWKVMLEWMVSNGKQWSARWFFIEAEGGGRDGAKRSHPPASNKKHLSFNTAH